MNKQQKIKLIKDLIKHYQELSDNSDKMFELFGADYDSKFFNSIWKAFDSYLSLVQKSIEDDCGFVSWFIYDNRCGKSNFICPINGFNKKVKTIEKLVDLIDAKK